MSEEINFDDIEFGEPIEEREPTYREGYIRGIYRARNIIDSKQKEIEKLRLHIIKIKEAISTWNIENDEGYNDFKIPNKIIDIVWSDD